MKLARPDVRHPRIVLAAGPGLAAGEGDDAGLVAALRTRGLHARWLSWDDPETQRADLVILRDTGDCADRREEFLAWTTSVPQLLNAPEVVAWNLDKGYLGDLSGVGVPVLSGEFVAPRDAVGLPAGDVVIEAGEADETVLVFLGGQQSHAFTAGPTWPPGRRPELSGPAGRAAEALSPIDADFALWDLGYAALAAAADHLGIAASELLYARVDVIGGPEDCLLRELGLVAPSLGWGQLAADVRARQQREFALSVESALDRLGLGPLSHRRP